MAPFLLPPDDLSRYALRSAQFGALFWLLLLVWKMPALFAPMWATMLLLLVPLVLAPLALRLIEPDGTWIILRAIWRAAILMQVPAALFILPAALLEPSKLAAALTLQWLLTTLLIAVVGVLRVWLEGWRSWQEGAISAGLVYVALGGVWLLFDRLGVQPLGFESSLVRLTAIHFHYAGFLLPLITGLAGREIRSHEARLATIGVTFGVPLVALGITATQLGFNPIIETIAAIVASLAALLTAVLHLRLARMASFTTLTRLLFALCGIALAGSMILSTLYGVRFYWPLAWLDIPWMRALHGTANALGFGLAGIVGWSLKLQK